jgi:hypothetical protein
MNTLLNEFGRILLESRGRNRPAPKFSFPDNEIVTPGEALRVSSVWKAIYLNLHPTHYAVAISPDGRFMNLRGGYNPLPPGRYILHYVDRQNRVSVIPKISETTLDGSQVSLEIVITYRVIDPIKALEVQHSVYTLFVFIQSDLKEFIRSHTYDEIVGGNDGRMADNSLVARYIRNQHASRHQMSKLFFIADIVVGEKVGDPKLTEIRENFQIEQRQKVADGELIRQNQDLQKKVASQDAQIIRIKAQSDVDQQDILQKIQLQKIELEKARMELHLRQEKVVRAMNAIVQAFSAPTYPRDPREVEIIKELLGALEIAPGPGPDAVAGQADHPASGSTRTANPERIDTLTDTLLNWLDRKRS